MNQTYKGNRITNKEVNKKFHSFCSEGDIKSGWKFLLSIEKPGIEINKLIKKVENRFFSDPPRLRFKTKIPWVRAVLKSYSQYFIQVLTKKFSHENSEKKLFKMLCKNFPYKKFKDLDEVESFLEQEFERVGWFFLGGITYPFRGPYIFEKKETKNFEVDLPLGRKRLKVVFLSKKHCNSWMDFASFGKIGTGGWAKEDGLYCVSEGYDVNCPRFKISYLKHEAQHFDDYERFPFVKEGHQTILEFRAKLVEIINADSPVVFNYFMDEAMANQDFPHIKASRHIKLEMQKKLGSKMIANVRELNELGLIKKMANEIFIENTEELKKGLFLGQNLFDK